MPREAVLVAASVFVLGVNVPVHVMLSELLIVLREPLATVMSSPLENPVAASENTTVTVGVSPAFRATSLIVKEDTEGALVSTV